MRGALLRSIEHVLRSFGLGAIGPQSLVLQLSGGTIQKVVLARELSRGCSLVVAAQPTRGLDVRAAVFMRDELRRAAAAGAAVVVISSDLDELLGLCGRVGVMHRGRLVGIWDSADAPRPVLAAAMGGAGWGGGTRG
jgi:simple sugar transport system ATP-binding protein